MRVGDNNDGLLEILTLHLFSYFHQILVSSVVTRLNTSHLFIRSGIRFEQAPHDH
jgi:hypothetical protein